MGQVAASLSRSTDGETEGPFPRRSGPMIAPVLTEEQLIRVGCPAHNCGGRCLLVAHVQDGVITRLDADDRPDTLAAPQLRACARGRAYLRRQYHPDNFLTPTGRFADVGDSRRR